MVNLMRKYQQALLLVVTFIIIIAFAALYNDYNFGGSGREDSVGTIYDRPVKLGEYQRGLRRWQLARELQMFELISSLGGRAQTIEEAQANFVFGTYVLRRESENLGLLPSDVEVVEATKKIAAFQENGQFDPSKYNMIVANIGRLGFDAGSIEEIVRDEIRFRKLRELFGTTIAPVGQQARDMYERINRKSEASVVRIKKDEVAATVKVTDEDIQKAFDARKETLKTDEMRKVKYVSFVLSEEEKKLQGSERAAVLQKLLDKAETFVVSVTEPNAKFDEVAQKTELKVAESPEFSLADPPAELADSSEVTAAAFKLTMEQPNSGAIRTLPNGYYVLHLTGINPARPLTIDEAKPKLAESLKQERTEEAMSLKGTEVRNKIDAELKAGKTFADAAQAAGLTAEAIPAFSAMQPPKPEVMGGREVVGAARQLEAGQLSEVIPIAIGSMIVHLDKHLPIDEAAYEKEKANLMERLGKQEVQVAFPLWFAERLKAANLVSKVGA